MFAKAQPTISPSFTSQGARARVSNRAATAVAERIAPGVIMVRATASFRIGELTPSVKRKRMRCTRVCGGAIAISSEGRLPVWRAAKRAS
jgi:hypothetical protein